MNLRERGLFGGGILSIVASLLVGGAALKQGIVELLSSLPARNIHTFGDFVSYLLEMSDAEFLGLTLFLAMLALGVVSVSAVILRASSWLISSIGDNITQGFAHRRKVVASITARADKIYIDLTHPESLVAKLHEIEQDLEQ